MPATKVPIENSQRTRKLRIISFTRAGSALNQKLCKELSNSEICCEGYTMERYSEMFQLIALKVSLSEWTKNSFEECDSILYIGACGIAVRAIAPYIKDKFSDPAVISMDERGGYIIPLLSGHVGGANELAIKIAHITGGVPVISTATDVNGVFAVDVFAKKNELKLTNKELAKLISADILDGKHVTFETELPVDGYFPVGIDEFRGTEFTKRKKTSDINFTKTENKEELKSAYKILVTSKSLMEEEVFTLQLIPQIICLGIGCRKNTRKEALELFVEEELEKHNISKEAIAYIASIDLKKEEEAICFLAAKYKSKFVTYSSDELKQVKGEFKESEFVLKTTGVGNVCERAALLVSNNGTMIQKKIARDGMTLAIAKINRRIFFE